jgi:acetyl-CoA carboxylase biotin carboxyl carrier protein
LEKANNSNQSSANAEPKRKEETEQQKTPAVQEKKQEQSEQAPAEKESKEPKSGSSTSEDDPSLHKITSPMVGTFYKSSSPEADPYVSKGDSVKSDSIVCIVEAMKLFNEIEAEVSGEIVEILVEDGQLVEYGQPLFLVKQK